MDNENEKEMTPEEAGKALSTWLPVDNPYWLSWILYTLWMVSMVFPDSRYLLT